VNKRLLKLLSVFLGIILAFQGEVLALEDYRNTNKIDYMDRIFRFDMGEFLDGYEKNEKTDEYEWYISILSDIGVYSKTFKEKKSDSQVTHSEIDSIITGIILKSEDYAKTYNAENTDRVTMYEALSKMCSMLGYDDIKEKLGIVRIASDNGLLSGISYNPSKMITFGEFSVLLWNTINSHGIERDFSIVDASYHSTDLDFMEYHLEISKVEGFVNAVNGLNIYKNQSPATGYLEIDRAEYYIGDLDAEEFLGHRIVAYTKKDKNNKNVIIHIENDEYDETVKIDLCKIDSVGTKVLYENESGATKSVDISGIENVMFNGDANASISVLNNYANMDGSVTFSKSDGHSNYNIAIINSYEYFVVYSVDENDEKIYLKDDAVFNGNNYIEIPVGEYIKCTLNGDEVDYLKYLPGNVIRVLQNTKKTYTEIVGFSNTVTGKITAYNRVTDEATINNTVYKVSKSYSSRSGVIKIETGLYGLFYISADKYIAGYKGLGEAMYGFLRNARTDRKTDESNIEVFTQDNEWKKINLKQKVTLDGNQGVEAKDAIDYIKTNNCINSLIRYKVNGSELVTFIDTMVDDLNEKADKDRLVKAYEGTVKMSWQGGRWFRSDVGYRILNDRPVFELPSRLEKTEDYKVISSANLNQDEKDTYITMYSANTLGLCQVAVISQQSDNVATDTTYWFYCESVSSVWDEEETEIAYKMNGKRLQNGGSGDAVDFSLMVTASKKENLENTVPGAIASGSLMRVTYNTDGYLTGADVKFTNATLPTTYVDKISGYFQHFCGIVKEIDTESGYLKVDCGSEQFVMPVLCVIVIDSNTYACRKIQLGEIRVGEQMFVFRAAGYGRICAIVR
jgi:hypothetical protein